MIFVPDAVTVGVSGPPVAAVTVALRVTGSPNWGGVVEVVAVSWVVVGWSVQLSRTPEYNGSFWSPVVVHVEVWHV